MWSPTIIDYIYCTLIRFKPTYIYSLASGPLLQKTHSPMRQEANRKWYLLKGIAKDNKKNYAALHSVKGLKLFSGELIMV